MKLNLTITRVFLILLALATLNIAVQAILDPQVIFDNVQVQLGNLTARNSVRASACTNAESLPCTAEATWAAGITSLGAKASPYVVFVSCAHAPKPVAASMAAMMIFFMGIEINT